MALFFAITYILVGFCSAIVSRLYIWAGRRYCTNLLPCANECVQGFLPVNHFTHGDIVYIEHSAFSSIPHHMYKNKPQSSLKMFVFIYVCPDGCKCDLSPLYVHRRVHP